MHTTLTCTELGQDQVRVLPHIGSPKAIHATKAHSPSCFVGCPMAWCARCSRTERQSLTDGGREEHPVQVVEVLVAVDGGSDIDLITVEAWYTGSARRSIRYSIMRSKTATPSSSSDTPLATGRLPDCPQPFPRDAIIRTAGDRILLWKMRQRESMTPKKKCKAAEVDEDNAGCRCYRRRSLKRTRQRE